jgi:hypothetical protein
VWRDNGEIRMPIGNPHLLFLFLTILQPQSHIVMDEKTENKPIWLSILRWCARIIAIIFIVFILFIFIGEGGTWSQLKGAPSLSVRDYIILSLFGLYVIGLMIGLWYEVLGGFLSFGFMMIHIIILVYYGNVPILFYIFFLPSILFILSWYLHQKSEFPE